VLSFAVLVASTFANQVENGTIDWSTVRPIEYYPKFWDDKPTELRPPAKFFKKYENGLTRIVGGRIAQPHQFPYQAGLLIEIPAFGTALCGGSLVSQRTTLTAAHCVDGATSGTVILGAHFLSNANEPHQRHIHFGSESILIHPSWNPNLIRDDVAIIRFPNPVQLIPGVIQTISLPRAVHAGQSFAGYSGLVSGWGVFSDSQGVISDVLRYVYNNIMAHANCAFLFFPIITNSMICLDGENGRGACNGDSGGPMVIRTAGGETLQVGIVSFGFTSSCELSLPSIFARTTSYINWLEANIV